MLNFSSNQNNQKAPNNFFLFAGIFILVVASVAGGAWAWKIYFSKEARDIAAFREYQQQVEDAYRNDTYGGATPEETLRLFVEALKKEDIELASKYFALDDNERNDTYLTYNNSKRALLNAQKENRLTEIINLVSKAEYESGSDVFNTASFVVYNNAGELLADIELWFNKLTKVWKIKNL